MKEPPVVSIEGIRAPAAAERKLGRLLVVRVQKRLGMGGAKINSSFRCSSERNPLLFLGQRSRLSERCSHVSNGKRRVFLGDFFGREALGQVVENDRESPASLDAGLFVTDVRIRPDVFFQRSHSEREGADGNCARTYRARKVWAAPFWTYRVSVAVSSEGRAGPEGSVSKRSMPSDFADWTSGRRLASKSSSLM